MIECAWCGDEVTGKPIRFKNMTFCSNDCRDEWEEDMEAGEEAEFEEDLEGEEFEDEDLIDDDDSPDEDEEEDRY